MTGQTHKGQWYLQRFNFLPVQATVAVQWEHGRPGMYRVIVEAISTYYNQQSYIVRVMKTGRLIHTKQKAYT